MDLRNPWIALRNLWNHTLRRNPWIAQESVDLDCLRDLPICRICAPACCIRSSPAASTQHPTNDSIAHVCCASSVVIFVSSSIFCVFCSAMTATESESHRDIMQGVVDTQAASTSHVLSEGKFDAVGNHLKHPVEKVYSHLRH